MISSGDAESIASALSYLERYLGGENVMSYKYAGRWAGIYVIDPVGNILEKATSLPVTSHPINPSCIAEYVEACRPVLVRHRLMGKPFPHELKKALDNRPTVPID